MKFIDYLDTLKGKRVAVIGAGISNTPLIFALLKAGVETVVCDKREVSQLGDDAERFKEMGAELRLGDGYLDNLHEDIIFRTPGLMPHHPAIREAVSKGATLTSEMEVFFELCPCKIIGITGSDGKTTTTAIIAKLLENQGKTVHVGGNIGTPLLLKTDDINPNDIAVVELSSFQLITMRRSPNIAVITNVAPNHLDIHSDFDEYMQAKRNIYMHQKPGDRLVLNFDDDITRGFAETAPAGNVVFFSMNNKPEGGVYLDGTALIDSRAGELCKASDIILLGAHNIANYLAAFASVRGLANADAMVKTAREFSGVAHRLEFVRELDGVKYYNDSIASSPSRTMAGLRSFSQKVILIAGGKDKGVTFEQLGREINKRVKKLILTGQAAMQIYDAVTNAPEYDGTLEIAQRGDFAEAVMEASNSAQSGDVVLLSPACTSFDMFSNFEERGNKFREIVEKLGIRS